MNVPLAILAAAGLAILCAYPSAEPRSAPGESVTNAQPAEWSARKRRYVRYYRYRQPAYAYRGRVYGRVNDPSIGPDGRPYRRPSYMTGCVHDDGYGRFSACPNR